MLDYLIKNARIVDGTGAPIFNGAVGVSGDKISSVIPEGNELPEAKTVIDAEGKLLTPGFIDIHSHADVSLPFCPQADNNIMQGITTFVGGNCGMGIAPAHNPEFVDAYMMKKLKLEGDLTVSWTTYKEWLDHLFAPCRLVPTMYLWWATTPSAAVCWAMTITASPPPKSARRLASC